MEIIESHIVPPNTERIRLSDYLPKIFTTIPSKKGLQKAIKRGEVFVDGEAAETGRWVMPDMKIELRELDIKPTQIFEFPFEVVYEDEHLAVINKPGGIWVNGNRFRTVQNALPFNIKYSSQKDALKKLLPVHRLDAPTCGLLLVAKTRLAMAHLGRQFQNKTIQKRYQAVAIGKISQEGNINFPIENKPSQTEFRLVHQVQSLKNNWLSLVDLFPKTGRTHQLRIHLSESSFPILGDRLYGKEGLILKGKGLFLCAVELTFEHPFSGEEMNVQIKAPNKFREFMRREENMFEKYLKSF